MSNVKPMIRPVTMQHDDRQEVRHHVGQRAAPQHRRARHRQRAEAVDEALVEVLVEPQRRDEAAEGDVLDDDPRDQEVDVRVPRRGDRAAEDVDEEQHEHHRLHGEGDQQVGRPRQAHQVALGDHERVGHQSPHAAFSSCSSLSASAAWPVSDRNTSSRVGRRSPRSSTRRRRRRAGGPPRRSCRCAGGP